MIIAISIYIKTPNYYFNQFFLPYFSVMSYLLDKSEQNTIAAGLLIRNNNLFAPSLHCSYYSCIQHMIQVLLTEKQCTTEHLREEYKDVSGSHFYYIQQIRKMLTAKKELMKERDFQREIFALKDFREKSDYYDEQITRDDAKGAMDKMSIINSLLKNVFGL